MTRYLPPLPGRPRIERRHIPTGLAGTRATVAQVARLICDGARDFYVRQKAIDILLAGGVAPKDYLGEIDALFRWVQRNVRYTKDPFRVEVLHSARRMLELRAGDCDDMTILLGSLVKSVGHPVRIVLTGPDPSRPEVFSHIYLEARHQDQWIPLDATMPHGMGWSPSTPVRQVLSIEEEETSDARADSDPAARNSSTGVTDPRARSRMVARRDPRHPPGRGAAARPTGKGPLGGASASPTARPRPLGSIATASRLAEGTQRPSSPANHAADPRAVAKPERGQPAAPSASRPVAHHHAGAALPDPPAGGAPTCRDAAARRPPAPGAAGAAARGANAQPPASALGAASALFRSFARTPAQSVERVAHPRLVPPVVVELGELAALVYRSRKWTGRPRAYIHFLDDPPRLVSDPSGRRLFIVGGSYRVTSRGIEG